MAISKRFDRMCEPWSNGVPWVSDLVLGYLHSNRHISEFEIEYPEYDSTFHMFCARESARATHSPHDEGTRVSYAALVDDIRSQAGVLFQNGVHMELVAGEPYISSEHLRKELVASRNVRIRRMDPMLSDHPMSGTSLFGFTDLELFRLVHDVVVHAAFGFSFGPRGEEAAARTHALLCSARSRPALFAETRMQSAFLFAGKQACGTSGRILRSDEPGFIPYKLRDFVEQKAFLPSPLCCDHHAWSDVPHMPLAA